MTATLDTLPLRRESTVAYALVETDWGIAGIIGRGESLARLIFPSKDEEQVHVTIKEFDATVRYNRHLFVGLQKDLRAYFQGDPVEFDMPIDFSHANVFGRKVLKTCAQIKYGRTLSYGQLAARSGHPRAARAVGSVMAQNPIPIIIPCHRVIAANGCLGGFSAVEGVKLKERLLKMEASSLY